MARTKLTKSNMKAVAKRNGKKNRAANGRNDLELLSQPTEAPIEPIGDAPLKLTKPDPGVQTPAKILADAAEQAAEESKGAKLAPLASVYINEAIQSLVREPHPNLYKTNPQYFVTVQLRARSLKAYCKEEGELEGFNHLLEDYAEDGDGIAISDALRGVMKQSLWMASIDTARYNRVEREYTAEQFDEDQAHGVDSALIGRDTVAPVGLEGANDNTDAIMGFSSDSERPKPPHPDDIVNALIDVNLWLNLIAEKHNTFHVPYASEATGWSPRGQRVFTNVENPVHAIELQSKANILAMQKKNAIKARADAAERKQHMTAVLDLAR